MDQEIAQQLPAAPYPAPPPFWKHFTSENVRQLKQISQAEDVSLELNFLRPPPPPEPSIETYKTFSTPWKLDPTPALPPPDILLFDHSDPNFSPARALKHLTRSLLLNFLELSSLLCNNPTKYDEKLQDIERLMLNIHFVVNLYRPHQAREGVREMLEAQLENGRREMQACDDMKERVTAYLKDLEQLTSVAARNDSKETGPRQEENYKQLWGLIHSLKDD